MSPTILHLSAHGNLELVLLGIPLSYTFVCIHFMRQVSVQSTATVTPLADLGAKLDPARFSASRKIDNALFTCQEGN